MNTFQKGGADSTSEARGKRLKKTVYIPALLLLLAAVACTAPGTFGKFLHAVTGSDSAFAAKFDIEVTAPGALNSSDYQHYFPMPGDEVSFVFSVRNNSEVAVICRPYINSGIVYRVLVGGEPQSEFAVGIGETVDFQVVITSGGLSVNITEASLLVDVQQL